MPRYSILGFSISSFSNSGVSILGFSIFDFSNPSQNLNLKVENVSNFPTSSISVVQDLYLLSSKKSRGIGTTGSNANMHRSSSSACIQH